MTTNQWRVRHPGIGVLTYDSEAEARVAAGTAGEVLGPAPRSPNRAAEHRPDVKELTPVQTVHITAECRNNPDKSMLLAFNEAQDELWRVYRSQVWRRPGATVSLALYVSDPEASGA